MMNDPNFPYFVFTLTKYIALAGWLALFVSLFMPKTRPMIWPLTQFVLPAILCLFYVLMVWLGRHFLHLPHSFIDLNGIGDLYKEPGPLAAGWLHFLALDMFVGAWIVRDGVERGMKAPLIALCLPFAFILAPSGLLLYLILRYATRPAR